MRAQLYGGPQDGQEVPITDLTGDTIVRQGIAYRRLGQTARGLVRYACFGWRLPVRKAAK